MAAQSVFALLFWACTGSETTCGVSLPGYDGPAIVSTNEIRYTGSPWWGNDLDINQLRTGDSLELNAALLDSSDAVFTTYSDKGQIMRQDFHDFRPDTVKKEYALYWVIFTYDKRDSLILETIMADSNKVLYTITHQRDNRGNRISKKESYKLSPVYEYQYNKLNQMTKSSFHALLSYNETAYEYDVCGRLAKSISSGWDYGKTETVFFYDEHNRMIKQNVTWIGDPKDGSGIDTSNVDLTYRYNEQGDLVEGPDETFYYNYDEFGNWIAKLLISYRYGSALIELTLREITYATS